MDLQGVLSLKKSGVAAKLLFVTPPSAAALEARLRARGTESEESLRVRVGNAKKEMEGADKPGLFDHVILNDDLDQASPPPLPRKIGHKKLIMRRKRIPAHRPTRSTTSMRTRFRQKRPLKPHRNFV